MATEAEKAKAEKLNKDYQAALARGDQAAAGRLEEEITALARKGTTPADKAAKKAADVSDGQYGISTQDEVKAVQEAQATGDFQLLDALKQRLGSIADIPTWLPGYLNRAVTAEDVPKLRQAWEAMTGEQLASDDEVLAKLNSPNELTTIVASTAFSNNEALELVFDLGPGFANQQARMKLEEADALRASNPRVAAQLRLLVPAATKSDVHPALLAAAADLEPKSLFSNEVVMDKANQRAMEKADGQNYRPSDIRSRGFFRVASELAMYKTSLGDDTLALIATVDPELAGRVKNNPRSLTAEQRTKLGTILAKAKWDPDLLAKQGLFIDTEKLAFIQSIATDADGKTPVEVTLPDQAAVKQSVQTLFRAWFQREPDEREVVSFTDSINSAVVSKATADHQAALDVYNPLNPSTHGGQPLVVTKEQVDPQARMEDMARAMPEYQKLFGQKSGNLSEEQYAQQHSGAAQRLFGLEGAGQSEAIRAGMEQGSTQTTMGALAGSHEATQNSTFQERMARVAQAIATMT